VCAVTGASGYLGASLASYLEENEIGVVRMSRPAGNAREKSLSFNLGESPTPGTFRERNVTALVHCAYDFSLTTRRDIQKVNVDGSLRLIDSALNEGVQKIVFISSISAFDGCRSLYGQAKLAVEKRILELKGHVVRPGLIYSTPIKSAHGGMFGRICHSILQSRIIPVIGNASSVQYLVHMEDLCRVVLALITPENVAPASPIVVASERFIGFDELLALIASAAGRSVRFVHIPWRAAWLGLVLAERLGMHPRFRSDSVIAFIYQDPHPDLAAVQSMGIPLRDFRESLC
jgi:nucleoside-diphosphate-sugar epimerase